MGSKFKKNLAPLRGMRLRDSRNQRHEVLMNQLTENMYDSSLDVSHDGPFDAICLSGIKKDYHDNSDPFAVHLKQGRYEVIFRGLISHCETATDPAGETDPETILDNILSHRSAGFVARADDDSETFPKFGQIIRVEATEGSFERGDQSKYIYRVASLGEDRITSNYEKLKTAKGVEKAVNTFSNRSNGVVRMGGVQPEEGLDVVSDLQIPGSILPIAEPEISVITSGFGMRYNRSKGEDEMHSGVDYGQTTGLVAGDGGAYRPGSNDKESRGMDIVSIFPGEITEVGPNGSGVHLTSSINREVARTGYGLVVKVKSTVEYGDGSLVEVENRYGHLYDIEPGLLVGTMVEQGDVLGVMGNRGGSRGVHLHFEALVGGTKVDPVFLYNWHAETPWSHSSQKERFYNEHPELSLD